MVAPGALTVNGNDASFLRWSARIGYAACGLVYIAIGVIAAGVAAGVGDRPGGAQHAMRVIEEQPFGKLFLVTLSVGLFGYAALNLSGALRDPEGRGRSFTGVLLRAADAVTGALYMALAVAAVRIAAAPSQRGGRIIESWAAGILEHRGGSLLLSGIGLVLLAAGGFLVHRARSEPFGDILDRRTLSGGMWRVLTAAARFGTLSRGLILGISGLLVVEAAATRQPAEVGGIGDALSAIEATPFGAWLLGAAALGFIAYGTYQLAKVRYRRVPIE